MNELVFYGSFLSQGIVFLGTQVPIWWYSKYILLENVALFPGEMKYTI